MPPPTCLRCLSRALEPIEASLPHTLSSRAAFSTSSRTSAAKKAAPAAVRSGAKTGKRLQLKKTTRTQSGRPPAPGERKAYRKRVVLSNTNALEVDLQDLTPDKLVRSGSDVALTAHRGRVLGLTNETVDALRALETFQPTQGWSLFRRPATLIRHETTYLADDVADMTDEAKKRQGRLVLDGDRGSGKSVLMLQAQAMALLKGCIVVHFPEAQDLVIAHTAYQPLETSEGTIYVQPYYTAKLLGNIAKANHALLSTLQISQQHQLPIPIQSNISLARFAELGAEDPSLAWPVWQALWSELTAPSQPDTQGLRRPPVMISMEGLNHTMRPSAYLDTDTKPIHAHDLALVKTFTDFLSGKTRLPNGGLVLAATNASNKASSPTLDHLLAVRSTPGGQTAPKWDPYTRQDGRVVSSMKGVEVVKVQGLSKPEARGIMEYYAKSGMVSAQVSEGLTSERWTLAGGGLIGEVERAAVRMRF